MAHVNLTRLVMLSRRKTNFYAIYLIVPCFSMVLDCIKIQEVFNEEIILRYTLQEEDMQYFTLVHCSHYFTWLWATRSKRVNEEIMLCFTV